MRLASAVAIVLPSLVMMSCVSDEGPSAGYARTERANPPEESRAAISSLVDAHYDYVAQVNNGGPFRPQARAECN